MSKPFTITLLTLVIGGSIAGFVFNPEIRWAIAAIWGTLIFSALCLAAIEENCRVTPSRPHKRPRGRK